MIAPERERGLEPPQGEAPDDPRSSTRRHLLRVLRESEVDLDFVAAEAGDQPVCSSSVRRHHDRIRRERGSRLYADMLFVLTQQRFPDRVAKWLWGRILDHQTRISRLLGRRAEITVASLDFLNQNAHLVAGSLVLCSESDRTLTAEVALRDGLTGLFDQATFRVRLERELERARRYGHPLAVLMIDLDRFKRLNDEHGHLEGDRVLATIGDLLRTELRGIDLAARYGGEEFAVVLPETEPGSAVGAAERVRGAIERRFADRLHVTASVGCASFPDDAHDAQALIAAADRALYACKASGRNRVRSSPPAPKGTQ